MKKTQYVKMDSRKRICFAKHFKNDAPELFTLRVENSVIMLEPVQEMPKEVHWLLEPENSELLEELKASLKETGTIDRGSFKKYLKD